MRFKALKHKTLKDTWGYMWGDDIVTDDKPQLLPERWDMDTIRRNARHQNEDVVLAKLKYYDLVTLEVNEVDGTQQTRSGGETPQTL